MKKSLALISLILALCFVMLTACSGGGGEDTAADPLADKALADIMTELNAAAGIMASSRANSGIAPIIAAILAQLEK